MNDRPLHPRSGASAKALLFTVLGEFVLPGGGSCWTQSIVQMLGLLGVEERNARQALARVADQGTLVGERHGRRTRWALTASGRELLSTGTERIYSFAAAADDWDERWLVVFCQVPEDHRAQRQRLRSRLSFDGFGWLAPGMAITPHLDREDAANSVLKDLGLAPFAVVLRAEAGSLVPAGELLDRAWDLDALAESYEEFIGAFERRAPSSPAMQMQAVLELVHAWRRFPFVDPEIPTRLLPGTWPGPRAKAVFDDRHAAWTAGAWAHYESMSDP